MKRSFLVLALIPFLTQCAAKSPDRAGVPRRPARTSEARAATNAPGQFLPAPGLQALIDPRPAEQGQWSWLGGDIASSIRLTDDHYIWLFGDTFVGTVETRCPERQRYCDRDINASAFPRNSVGVMRRRGGTFQPIQKYWATRDGTPTSLIEASDPEEFLWPLAGTTVGHRLVMAASRHTKESGLSSVGDLLVVVENPRDEPTRWRYSRHPLPDRKGKGGAPASWVTGIVHERGYLYLVGSAGEGFGASTVLARVSTRGLGPHWFPTPWYYVRGRAGRPTWSTRYDPDLLLPVEGLPGTSERTLDRGLDGRWHAFQLTPFAYEIRHYSAPRIFGPWTGGEVVYVVPPPWSTEGTGDCQLGQPSCAPRFIAYGAKSHPALAAPGQYAISYNVNVAFATFREALEAAEERNGFYVPQLVRGAVAGRVPLR